MTCLHLTVGEVGTMPPDEAFEKAVASIKRWEAEVDRYPAALLRVRSAADIRAAKANGRTGLMYGFQDGVCFETDLDRLETFHRLGIRVIQPTYNRRNRLGDGCMEPADAGLSKLGHEAVERMNELGILVDGSHCGRVTAADAIRRSSRPVAFTHTGCAALADHPRNRTDAELRAVAEHGRRVGHLRHAVPLRRQATHGRRRRAAHRARSECRRRGTRLDRHGRHALDRRADAGIRAVVHGERRSPQGGRHRGAAGVRDRLPVRERPQHAAALRAAGGPPQPARAIRTTGSRRSWAPTCCASSTRRGTTDARNDADVLPPPALPGLPALRRTRHRGRRAGGAGIAGPRAWPGQCSGGVGRDDGLSLARPPRHSRPAGRAQARHVRTRHASRRAHPELRRAASADQPGGGRGAACARRCGDRARMPRPSTAVSPVTCRSWSSAARTAHRS